MTTFYSALCQHYDHIFSLDAHQQKFVAENLQEHSSILEVGAATGNLTLHLADRGFEIDGIDLNEDMIRIANQKKGDRSNVRLTVLDMRHLESTFEAATFDGMICVGNTLVHLPDKAAVEAALKDMHRLLRPGGKLILQIINYDRIFSKQLTGLPTIDNEHITFERQYKTHGEDAPLDFETTLTVKATGEVLTQTTKLLPLRQSTLLSLLADCGFRDAFCHGSFKGEPFDGDVSVQLIVCCTA